MPLAAPTSKTARILGSLIAPAAGLVEERGPLGGVLLEGGAQELAEARPVLGRRRRPALSRGRIRAAVTPHVYRRVGTRGRVLWGEIPGGRDLDQATWPSKG